MIQASLLVQGALAAFAAITGFATCVLSFTNSPEAGLQEGSMRAIIILCAQFLLLLATLVLVCLRESACLSVLQPSEVPREQVFIRL